MDRELVLATVSDLAVRFVLHDRKDDPELSTEDLRKVVTSGEVTIDELVSEFKAILIKWKTNKL